jgi:hypothetical protein
LKDALQPEPSLAREHSQPLIPEQCAHRILARLTRLGEPVASSGRPLLRCRRQGIAANFYYRWSKDFLEAGKKRLAADTVREATSDEVKDLQAENRELKEVVAEITLKNRVLKKSLTGSLWRDGEEDAS